MQPLMHKLAIQNIILFEGWTVIRFWGKDIRKNIEECVRVVEETVWDIKMDLNIVPLMCR